MAKQTRKSARKPQARRKLPTKVTRKLEHGFVIAVYFPETIIADSVCYIGEKKVWFDPSKGIIGRPEARVTDYHLSNLTDAHIFEKRFDVERELASVSSFLLEQSRWGTCSAQVERVRWVPKQVISTRRPLRKVKKYPMRCNPKLKVRISKHRLDVKFPINPPDVNRLLAIAKESQLRETQIIQP